ncbi:uncharacterized protein BDR25DRAFT_350944 [Lindgomyces ingoldianus]|uniref:Uncharacterized protein n=1 Tax=Lindgomyces ingoldianus TaxID=673940 RepID=A0ACB6R8D6_9PLEO|nr:uncharacterized protein BDR25DRAFT_350944 [Lindgomyces ingoldianus]KAF2475579.1 hypothetical protein BDR25DRAFT_350944 [Lindgomyces ingoldianus]
MKAIVITVVCFWYTDGAGDVYVFGRLVWQEGVGEECWGEWRWSIGEFGDMEDTEYMEDTALTAIDSFLGGGGTAVTMSSAETINITHNLNASPPTQHIFLPPLDSITVMGQWHSCSIASRSAVEVRKPLIQNPTGAEGKEKTARLLAHLEGLDGLSVMSRQLRKRFLETVLKSFWFLNKSLGGRRLLKVGWVVDEGRLIDDEKGHVQLKGTHGKTFYLWNSRMACWENSR